MIRPAVIALALCRFCVRRSCGSGADRPATRLRPLYMAAGAGSLDAVRKQCGAGNPADIQNCFIAAMKNQARPTPRWPSRNRWRERPDLSEIFQKDRQSLRRLFRVRLSRQRTRWVALVNGSPSPDRRR